MPTKKELLGAISWLGNCACPCFIEDKDLFDKNIIMIEDFINDNFELIEKMTWLRNSLNEDNGMFDFIFKDEDEVKGWLDRIKWYIKKCDESGRELYELKNNPPLKFDEIKDGDWVWNNVDKEYIRVYRKHIATLHNSCYVEGTKVIQFIHPNGFTFSQEYKEDEIYRWQVIDDE